MGGEAAPPAHLGGHGWAYTRLIELHDAMRRDVALLRRASAAVAGGEQGAAEAALRELSMRRPGWTLTRFCAAFCGFVHEHHAVEDAVMFPMVLQHGNGDTGELRAVMAKLTADHQALAGRLAEVEQTLGQPGSGGPDLARAVARLAEDLEEHLAFEEASLGPALDAVSRVVSEEDVPAPPPDPLDA